MTGEIIRRLRFPVAVEKKVRHLIRHHMFNYGGWSDSAVRRFSRVSERRTSASRSASRTTTVWKVSARRLRLEEFGERIARTRQDHAFSLSDLAVNGNDLAGAGIPPGRSWGCAEVPARSSRRSAMNTREQLLGVGLNYYRTFLGSSA